jgi:hemerythrin-like metal-binding protein
MGHDMEFGVYYREHSQARQAKRALVAAGSPRAAQAPVPMVVPAAGTTPRYWRADLATGIPKLDEQHKEIFRQAEIIMDRNRAGQIPETLNFLLQYTGRHFGAEENAQAATGYPGLEAHRKEHAGFIRRFQELKKRFETADQARQAEAAKDAARFLVEWFRAHIMNQDQYFAAHYKKNQRAAGRKKQGFLYRLFHFWSGP